MHAIAAAAVQCTLKSTGHTTLDSMDTVKGIVKRRQQCLKTHFNVLLKILTLFLYSLLFLPPNHLQLYRLCLLELHFSLGLPFITPLMQSDLIYSFTGSYRGPQRPSFANLQLMDEDLREKLVPRTD